MPTKVCRKCQIEKPLEDFYKYSNYYKDAWKPQCKECDKKERYPKTIKEPEGKSYAERLAEYKEINKKDYASKTI